MAIDKHGSKWRVRKMVKGIMHKATFDTEEEAQDYERSLSQGTIPQLSDNLFATTLLKDEITDYQKRVLKHKKKGVRQYENRLAYWADSSFGDKTLSQIQLPDIQAWVDREVDRGSAPNTIANKLGVLSNVFRECARKPGYKKVMNPVKGVRRPKPRKHNEVYWTDAMYEALTDILETSTLPWFRPVILLAINTGMRAGEIRTQMYRRNYRGKHLLLEDTKNDEKRRVPLNSEARAVLDEWITQNKFSPNDLLFPLTEAQVSQAWIDAWDKAEIKYGVPHITMHDLRHVALTKLSKKLHNVLELSAVSGHKDLNMLRRYYQPDPDELAERLG